MKTQKLITIELTLDQLRRASFRCQCEQSSAELSNLKDIFDRAIARETSLPAPKIVPAEFKPVVFAGGVPAKPGAYVAYRDPKRSRR